MKKCLKPPIRNDWVIHIYIYIYLFIYYIIYIHIYVSDFSDTGDSCWGVCRKEANMFCRKIAHIWTFFFTIKPLTPYLYMFVHCHDWLEKSNHDLEGSIFIYVVLHHKTTYRTLIQPLLSRQAPKFQYGLGATGSFLPFLARLGKFDGWFSVFSHWNLHVMDDLHVSISTLRIQPRWLGGQFKEWFLIFVATQMVPPEFFTTWGTSIRAWHCEFNPDVAVYLDQRDGCFTLLWLIYEVFLKWRTPWKTLQNSVLAIISMSCMYRYHVSVLSFVFFVTCCYCLVPPGKLT